MRHGGMSCVLATVMLLSAGCGGSDDTGAPAGEDALPSDVLDIVSDGDGAPPGVCMVDEACRQSLSLGPCEEARCVDGG